MSLLDVIFPVSCPGCGQWDVPACDACLDNITAPVEVSHRLPQLLRIRPDGEEVPLLPIWAMSSYEETKDLIQAWKMNPSTALDRLIGARIERAARALPDLLDEMLDGTGEVDFVPAPSRPARYRADTYVAGTIADSVARGFAAAVRSPMMVSSRTMFLPRQGRQRGRSRRERRLRAPVRLIGDLPPRKVILVDDVATTGSTFEACWQALDQGGHAILGGVCASAVIRPAEFHQNG